MLPVYMEFVVHLRSKSSCSVMFSLLSNASEVNDGVAVPFFCITGGVSAREVRINGGQLTIFSLQSS